MKGHMDLTAIVFLAIGGAVAYIAYQDAQLGSALLVGAGVVTLLYLLLRHQP
ncbi:hypothetical protein AB0K68_36235 [Streptomyces sp. NPDC050698]